MISREQCRRKACEKALSIFGEKYLAENKSNTCISFCIRENNYCLFIGVKTNEQCPHMEPNDIGWCVYADIDVNMETGNVVVIDYQIEQ